MVGSLGLPVRLGVIGSANVLFNVQVFAEFPHCGGHKSGVAVRDDVIDLTNEDGSSDDEEL